MNNYIIINEDKIKKRIEDLENYTYATQNLWQDGKIEGELQLLKKIISQSIPLIPEIEKSFGLGAANNANGQPLLSDYISNLKLDI